MIIVYNKRGEIQYTVDDPYPAAVYDTYEQLQDTNADFFYVVVAQTNISGMYIDPTTRTVQKRPLMNLDVPKTLKEGDSISLSLPVGATVYVDGCEIAIGTQGQITLEVDDPGQYTIGITCWPFHDFEAMVVVQ